LAFVVFYFGVTLSYLKTLNPVYRHDDSTTNI